MTEQDLIGRIQAMAHRYEMPFDKMVRDLRKRDAIPMLQEQILCAKALDLIVAGVTVRPKPDADPSLPVSAEG